MAAVEVCPSCNMSLRLFTPRECERHVNDCLDAGTPEKRLKVECAVCKKDLSSFTKNAQEEHANLCADSLLPKISRPRPAPRAAPASRNRLGVLPQRATPALDPKVKSLLDALGLARYGPKFANEEIDLDALRLLTDGDLAALRIPDAARRRIAEALHSVALLNRIADGSNADETGSCSELPTTPAPLTQQFQESRIANGVRRRKVNLENLESDDDDDLLHIYDTATFGSPQLPTDTLELSETGVENETLNADTDESRENGETELPINFGDDIDLDSEKVQGSNNGAAGNAIMDKSVQICSPPALSVNESPLLPDYRRNDLRPQSPGSGPTSDGAEEVPATMSELEKWRTESTREELQRHKRKMESIDETYRRLKRRLEVKSAERPVKVDVKKPDPVITHSPIDLTLDTPVKTQAVQNLGDTENEITVPETPTEQLNPETRSRLGNFWSQVDDIPMKTQTANSPRRPRSQPTVVRTKKLGAEKSSRLRNFQSQIVDDSSSAGSLSDDDFTTTTFSSRVATVLNQRKETPGEKIPREIPDNLFDDAPLLGNHKDEKPSSALQEGESQSCDELMDLTQPLPVEHTFDRYVPNMDDSNTRESCSGIPVSSNVLSMPLSVGSAVPATATTAAEFTVPVCTARSAATGRHARCSSTAPVSTAGPSSTGSSIRNASTVAQENHGDARPKKSRLRKPKKVTPSDLRSAIRADPKLLDDILMLKSVDIDRVMSSVKSFGLNVSQKKLVDFMHSEGLPFKEAPAVNNNEKSKQYFVSLCTEGFY